MKLLSSSHSFGMKEYEYIDIFGKRISYGDIELMLFA